MPRECHHCGHEETDDAFFCSRCRGRLDVASCFDGATPRSYDEYIPDKPYMVLGFPFRWFETASITYDQFLARTLFFVMGLIFICSFLVMIGAYAVALLESGFLIFLYYIVWMYGRREAQRRNLGL